MKESKITIIKKVIHCKGQCNMLKIFFTIVTPEYEKIIFHVVSDKSRRIGRLSRYGKEQGWHIIVDIEDICSNEEYCAFQTDDEVADVLIEFAKELFLIK